MYLTTYNKTYEVKTTKLKWETAEVNIPLLTMDSTTIKKRKNETKNINNTINQIDLTNVYSMVHSTTTIQIFSNAHGIFFRIDHMLSQRKSQ